MSILFELFINFFSIGLFSFGGGYAIIPLLQDIAVSNGWLSAIEFADIVAVSQVTPGPIAVNMATFVGFRQAGVIGSLLATFSVSLPSMVLVCVAVYFIAKVNNSKTLKSAFYGLRPAAAGLIGASAITIMWSEFFGPLTPMLDFGTAFGNISILSIIVAIIAFVCMYKFKTNPIYVILGAAVVGLIFA